MVAEGIVYRTSLFGRMTTFQGISPAFCLLFSKYIDRVIPYQHILTLKQTI
jgi:hypothetical protein